MISRSSGTLGVAVLAFAAAFTSVGAQSPPPSNGTPPAANPACVRLESQLAAFDRGGTDSARAEQIKRVEESGRQQQFELDRLQSQARRGGCESSGFFLFGGQSPQCADLNSQIQRARANVERINAELRRLQGSTPERLDQRRALLAALAQNDCGPQYRAAVAARPQGFFETLFGPSSGPASNPSAPEANPDVPQSSTFRTLCVRTCDGFYYPISFATVPAKFRDDERVCQRTCPNAEVVLFSHRNPGEDVAQAVSIAGKSYRELPAAFHYRQQVDPNCTCRRPGQSWAEALGTRDTTVERGDIIVTDERAKALSQPKADPAKAPPKQGRTKGPGEVTSAPPATEPPPAPTSEPPDKSSIRAVGPKFLPTK